MGEQVERRAGSQPSHEAELLRQRLSITKFTIPVIGCTSVTGYQNETINIPSVPVHHGHFPIQVPPPRDPPAVRVKLSGKLAGREVAGTVSGTGLCATGPQPFHANPGKFRPVKSVAPTSGSCTMAGCLASNGMFIQVTMVDRMITSVDDPSNIYNSSADPFLANGGVGISVVGTDRSAQDPFTFAPVANFQLRLGQGELVGDNATNSTVVSGSGAQYPCADPTSSQQQLTHGASDGPVNCATTPTAPRTACTSRCTTCPTAPPCWRRSHSDDGRPRVCVLPRRLRAGGGQERFPSRLSRVLANAKVFVLRNLLAIVAVLVVSGAFASVASAQCSRVANVNSGSVKNIYEASPGADGAHAVQRS